MGKLIGLLLVVVGIWVGAEVYMKGVGGAFGGALATGSDAAETRTAPRRAGDAVQSAHDGAAARRERMLAE